MKKKITSLNRIEDPVENWLEIIQRQLEHQGQEGLDEVRLDRGDVGVVGPDDVPILEEVLEQSQARRRDGESGGLLLKHSKRKVRIGIQLYHKL